MASAAEADFGDSVDLPTFEQILEMDDDEEERDFSKSLVYGFFEQAETTFQVMQKALSEKDLTELSSKGHFLKGSSSAIGLNKIRDCCEKIQHYGSGKDENGNPSTMSDDEALAKIKEQLTLVRQEYAIVEKKLRRFFGEDPSGEAA